MAVAILHAEYAPAEGFGGRCASGEFIVGPAYNTSPYQNRFTVFDPVAKTAKTYAVTVPFNWYSTSYGVPYRGGVAVAASAGASTTYLLVLYPDGTYDVHATPLTSGAALILAVVPSGDLWMFRQSATASASVWDGTSWSLIGSSLPGARSTMHLVGSALWYMDNSNRTVAVSTVTGALTTTYTTGSLTSSPAQAEIYDGRIWVQTSQTNLRGVRLSDGNTVNITTPSATPGRLALGVNKFWIAYGLSGYEIDPATSNSVAHPHPSNIGGVSQIFYGAGRAWAMGSTPQS